MADQVIPSIEATEIQDISGAASRQRLDNLYKKLLHDSQRQLGYYR